MAAALEREPAEILLLTKMNNNSNAVVRKSPAKRPLEEENGAIGTAMVTCPKKLKVSPSNVIAGAGYNPQAKQYLESTWESDQPPVQGEVEVTATQAATAETTVAEPPRQTARIKEQQALLAKPLKESLKRLKNLLKLPQSRRWAYCEFFYSDIDRELLLTEYEFRECLRESFPNLKTHRLKRAEWRQVRRLFGRPRRCSQAFFDLERAALEARRDRIRDVHTGMKLNMDVDEVYIPSKVPKPLAIGAKVYARVRHLKDGVYSGKVDGVMDGRYRVVFDKDVVMPMIVPDYEVMRERPEGLVPISYFLEKNKTAQAQPAPPATRNSLPPTPSKGPEGGAPKPIAPPTHDPVLTSVNCSAASSSGGATATATAIPTSTIAAPHTREDRCGNYPLRLIVILVKLSKLMDTKKVLISHIQEMNNEAERMQLYGEEYIKKFQDKYAKVVMDLNDVNRQLEKYLCGMSEYMGTLVPQLTEITVTSRPELLYKFCQLHAAQMVKNSRRGLNLRGGENATTDLITSLTAVLLQMRALGQQQCKAYDLHSLQQTMKNIKDSLRSQNRAVFEDNAEVHVKQFEFTMQGGEAITLSNLFR